MYLIPVQNKSSLCTSILSYEDNSITRHLMILFLRMGAVQNRIYQHVCVCKEQACTSTIKLSVSGSMCLIHSTRPLHSPVNNRDEPAPKRDYMFEDSKPEYLWLSKPTGARNTRPEKSQMLYNEWQDVCFVGLQPFFDLIFPHYSLSFPFRSRIFRIKMFNLYYCMFEVCTLLFKFYRDSSWEISLNFRRDLGIELLKMLNLFRF